MAKFKVFLLNFSIWEVSLESSLRVQKLWAVVKFAGFQAFECFRNVEAANYNSSEVTDSLIFLIKRTKLGLFRHEPKQLYSILNYSPLYIIFARCSKNQILSNADQIIGLSTVPLVDLIDSFNMDREILYLKEKPISGLFPIRDLMGRTIGHVRLRACLFCMPGKILRNLNCDDSTIQPHRIHSLSSPKSMDTEKCESCNIEPRSISLNREIQTSPRKLFLSLENSTQTEENGSDKYDGQEISPIYCFPQIKNTKRNSIFPGSVTEVTCVDRDSQNHITYNASSNIFKSSTESFNIAPIQPSGCCFGQIQHDQTKTKTCETVKPNLSDYNSEPNTFSFQRLAFDDQPDGSNDTFSNMNKVDLPTMFSLPVLKSLMNELKLLKDENYEKFNTIINDNQFKSFLQLIQNELHSNPNIQTQKQQTMHAIKTNKSSENSKSKKSLPTTKYSFERNHSIHGSGDNSRKNHLRKLALPKELPPAPGKLVPKDRGWLRSTPIYRGPLQSSIIPRTTLTHKLRMKKSQMNNLSRNSKSFRLHSSNLDNNDFICNHHQQQQRQEHQNYLYSARRTMEEMETDRLRTTKSYRSESKQTDNKQNQFDRKFERLNMEFNSTECKSSIIGTDSLSIEKQSANNLFHKDMSNIYDMKNSANQLNNESDVNQSKSTFAAVAKTSNYTSSKLSSSNTVTSSADLLSENLLQLQPKQSDFSPQMSVLQSRLCEDDKFNQQIQLPLIRSDDPNLFESSNDFKQISNEQLLKHITISENINSDNMSVIKQPDEPEPEEGERGENVTNTYSDDYEESDDEILQCKSDNIKSIEPMISENVYKNNEIPGTLIHNEPSNHLNLNLVKPEITKSVDINTATHITNSFTKITTNITSSSSSSPNTLLDHHNFNDETGQVQIELNLLPSSPLFSEENITSSNNAPTNSYSVYNTHDLDEFDIEAIRSRGSHDYIIGGSAIR